MMHFKPTEPVHFDSDQMADGDTSILAHSMLSAVLGPVLITVGGDTFGTIRGVACRLAELQVMTLFLEPKITKVIGQGEPGADGVLMLRSMEGPLIVRQGGQQLAAENGDFVLLSSILPFELVLPEGGRIDCGRMSVDAFPVPRDSIGRFLLKPIPKAHPPLLLLITHGAYLLMRGTHGPGEAELVVSHFKQILPLVLEYLKESSHTETAGDKLLMVKALIEERLSDTSLDLSDLARSLGVTTRHVQKLFQRQGTTFSRYVLERRLDMAHALISRHGPHRAISTVAYELGFGDLSYFNRTFRRRFGTTPSSMRGQGSY
jgi:AraC-like DNA-binding protein